MEVRLREAVPVVPFEQQPHQPLLRGPVRPGGLGEPPGEAAPDLLLGEAQHPREVGVQGEVRQVVQLREERHMGEFAHAGHQDEAEHLRLLLDHGVEHLERRQEVWAALLGDVAQDGLVVLVQEDDDVALPVMERLDELVEHRVGGVLRERDAMAFGLLPEHEPEPLLHLLHRAEVAPPHVQMDDRVDVPAVVLVVEGKPPEQLPTPLEDGLQRRDQQRLPEAARARQEVQALGGPDQPPDVLRLVHIEEIPLDQVPE